MWDDEWAWPEEQCVMWWMTIHERERAIFRENVQDKLNTPMNSELTGPYSGVHMIGAGVDCKHWTSVLSAAKAADSHSR